MSKFTDIFIRRPVLATVVSLLIFVVGIRAIFDLQVRQYPKMDNTVVNITTSYPGASAQLVEGFITTPLEKKIAGAEGIDYMTSSSTDGVSSISAYIKLNFSPDSAFTNILSKVQAAKQVLPKEAEDPVLDKQTGSTIALMYISFSSNEMSGGQITDYLSRVVQPKLETIGGVAQAQILGSSQFAMRIWLSTRKMAGLGVTPNDVQTALQNNNIQSAAGHTKGKFIQISIKPETDLKSVKGFENIVVKTGKDGSLIHMKDIGRVDLGSETYDSSVYFNGKKAVFMAITATPSANALSVITDIKNAMPFIQSQFPPTLKSKIVYDATKYIRSSIKEVIKTIIEATLIVIVVIFLFLGSLRTVTIPVVTIPLSLVGVCGLMLILGYSINLLTLLALVLAIGMVVDDAIVVVENIYRHIEDGMDPKDAAIKGAREIALPIISMTLTLAAVYAPIGLMGGITGALFKEFAFTLAGAVIISGVIALTLSPMMCSKLLNANIGKHKLVHFIDDKFNRLKNSYQKSLANTLKFRPVIILFAFVVLSSCMFLYLHSRQQLAPEEDQGAVFTVATGPQSASLNYMEHFTNEFNALFESFPSFEDSFIVNGRNTVNSTFAGFILKPWDERSQTTIEVNHILQKKYEKIPGLQIQSFSLPPLPTGGSPIPIQFIITTTSPFNVLFPVSEEILNAARKSGKFIFITNSLKFNKPQMDIEIDRDKAAEMGIGVNDIAQGLATAFGDNYVNRFSVEGQNYKVIPQVLQQFRYNPKDIDAVYLKTGSGDYVPLSSVVSIKFTTQPNALTRFQQLNSATLQGLTIPGQTIADGLSYLRKLALKFMPQGFSYNYAGQSRQLMQEGSALMYTFFFSIIFIFLVLAAQFESFRDPLVVMTSVPMAICGALLPLNWGFATVNIYTQIGLITLIGLISKHGILMVEFANKLGLEEGLSRFEAIEKAAAIRLRPVLMTTFSMVLGVVPLLLATGAGANSRFDIGLVIASGMLIGTLFTLFVVPVMYTLKAQAILLLLASVAAADAVVYNILYVIF